MEGVRFEQEAALAREVGDLIRMVGHNLRNDLGVMGNSTYYLTMKLGQADPKIVRHLGVLAQKVAKMNREVANLMDLLAPKAPKPVPLNLNDLLKHVVERNIPSWREGPRPQLKAEVGEVFILGDGEQILRALENLLLYRCESLGPADILHIAVSAQGGKGWVEFVDGAASADLAALLGGKIAPEESAAHLGLLVAQRLLALNDGNLEGMSLPEGGTLLRAWLPLA